MTSDPCVSVIIPTYNHQKYVLDTINSVFAQTFGDYEVIVVNDGSPDETAQTLYPLISDGKIRYYEQTNAGQAAARNRGLTEARGEFIAFLDDDDLWPPNKLAWQVETLRRTGALLVGGRVIIVQDGKPQSHQPITTITGKITKEDLAGGAHFFSPGQTLIRREAINAVGGFDTAIWGVDDYDLYLSLEKHGVLRIEDRPSLFYRVHDANASKQRDRMLVNLFKVARKHFPRLRSTNAKKLYKYIYEAAGQERITAAKKSLRMGKLFRAGQHLWSLRPFVVPAANNPALARRLLADLLPARFVLGNHPH